MAPLRALIAGSILVLLGAALFGSGLSSDAMSIVAGAVSALGLALLLLTALSYIWVLNATELRAADSHEDATGESGGPTALAS